MGDNVPRHRDRHRGPGYPSTDGEAEEGERQQKSCTKREVLVSYSIYSLCWDGAHF